MQECKIYLSYPSYKESVKKLAELIRKSGITYKNIFTFPRGGLWLAAELGYELEISDVIALPVNPQTVPTALVNKFLDKYLRPDTLIVDDISHTGETLGPFNTYYIACLYYKESTKVVPKYHCGVIPDNVWIVFPWEKEDSPMKRDRD